MQHRFFLTIILAAFAAEAFAAKPRLIVNIVVSSMRADDIDRYAANLGQDGILRLANGGIEYTDARYDYQQTTTPVSLATITTGAQPSTHGIVSRHWRDYVENKSESVIGDTQNPSAKHLIAPTISQALIQQLPKGKVVTVAIDPVSAIIMAGKSGDVFWVDSTRCDWVTSPCYASKVPDWVEQQNQERFNQSYIYSDWSTMLDKNKYINSRSRDILLVDSKGKKFNPSALPTQVRLKTSLDNLAYTPAGNTAVIGFAKNVVAQYRLGADNIPDILNICLDSPRMIAEAYGPESIEVEDMYYRLDKDIADMLTYLYAQVKNGEVVVVFTSDHGTSPSYDLTTDEDNRFNARQFEVIVNGFLNVRYGVGNWVLEYEDKCIYLNHNLIYERGLNLADVQNEVAIFAMQFRGVSHALSSTAMRTSYFGSGYARKMQNSFYPRRSGDVIINFMPGWIELQDRCRSASGSMYGYDTNVPLIFYGNNIKAQKIGRTIDMTSVASTLAQILGITNPSASEGDVLTEVTNL